MNKTAFMRLWDIYNGLLTETQQEITNLYFNLDLTVSEIAEEKGISRQAVSECLKTCKKQLEEFDGKLNFDRALHEISLDYSFRLTEINRWAEDFKSFHPQFSAEIEKLLKILNKDYSAEVDGALNDPEIQKLINKDFSKRISDDDN